MNNGFWEGSYLPHLFHALHSVLPALSGQVTEARDSTVGGSDIGSCPLKVVQSKRDPVEYDEQTLMRFLSGHTREMSLTLVHDEACRQNGWWRLDQQRFTLPEEPRIRVHVDRIFMDEPTIDEATSLRVMEEKHPEMLPEVPYDSWVYQLQLQVGLVKANHPTKQVDGSPLVTTHSQAEDYGGAWEFNPDLFQSLVTKGKAILAHLDRGTDPAPEPGLLCGHCPYIGKCPAFGDKLPSPIGEDVLGAMLRLKEISKEKKALEKECSALKEQIKRALWGNTPPRKFKGTVAAGVVLDYAVRNGRKSCDLEILEREFLDAFQATVAPGAPYDVLQIL